MKFIIKLIAGILVGILVGHFAPENVSRIFITFEHLFNEFLGFVIPFIIFFFIASGITNLKSNSGQTLGITLGTAYLSTILAGFFAVFVALTLSQTLHDSEHFISPVRESLKAFFTLEIDPVMDVTTALVCAFIFGIGAGNLKAQFITRILGEGRDITELVISALILPLLPFYIAGVFVNFTTQGTIGEILQAFGLVLLLAVTLHWVWLFVLYSAAGAIGKRNVFTALKNMLPAYMTGIGTMSSVATIPVALKCTRKNGVSEAITNFTIPLFANIHLSGSTITLSTCAIAVMVLTQSTVAPSFLTMVPFILMLGLVMVAAPGVPGGAVMSALGVLGSMLGFDESALGLIIALYITQDSFGTACNVTGDGALAIMVDRFVGNKTPSPAPTSD
jgi:Na+/H+-dicarboxylate symporter